MAPININDVTTTLPSGDGVFDVLMRSIDSHLDKQYTSGRIKGTDYATVYLGALQTVLQQSIMFVLSEQKAEKEIEAMDEQIAASKANTAMKQSQTDKTNAIYEAQRIGFKQDYKLKVAKAMLDIRTTGLTQGNEGISSEGGDAILKVLLADAELPFNAYGGGTVPSGVGQFLIDPA